jgi:ribosomal protein S21|tara:strand:+ start:9218 stop:9463 length:246 start_codon:yes stop_codon:yes gene_type:complete
MENLGGELIMPRSRRAINVEVRLDEVRGDQNRLIKRFMKKVKKERIIEDYLEKTAYYEKPSVKRRKEKLRRKRLAKKNKEV